MAERLTVQDPCSQKPGDATKSTFLIPYSEGSSVFSHPICLLRLTCFLQEALPYYHIVAMTRTQQPHFRTWACTPFV